MPLRFNHQNEDLSKSSHFRLNFKIKISKKYETFLNQNTERNITIN
jgi:hypothetical protein